MHETLNKLLRTTALKLPFMTEAQRVALARRIRGREEWRKLRAADGVFLSYGKSGRTWVRVMLSRVYQLRYGLPESELLNFDNLKCRHGEIPAIFFTHGNYLEDFTGNSDWKKTLKSKKVVWLVRDPRDVAVSLYFQWKHRMTAEKIAITRYPKMNPDLTVHDFVMGPGTAFLRRILDHLSEWERELSGSKEVLLLRYEDFRREPAENLRRMVAFLGTAASEEEIQSAVEFAAFDNMKKMEAGNVFSMSGGRVATRKPDNPDAYKARRAKVGGWRDYFSDDEASEIDALVSQRLSPSFGYLAEEASADIPVNQEAR